MDTRTRWIATAAAALILDQATKAAALAVGSDGPSSWNQPGANSGLSLGIGDGSAGVIVAAVAGVLLAVLLAVPLARTRPELAWAAGLLAGGAASNLLDRLWREGVIDFVPVGPVVLNLADLAVVVGLAVIGVATARHSTRGTSATNTKEVNP